MGEPDVYLPVLLEGDDGIAPGNDWAHGFMRGVQTRPASWGELIDDEDHGGPMLRIMMLHYENDPDPQMRPPPIPSEKREELLQTMIGSLTHIYRYFEPHRRALASMPAHLPMRREGRRSGATNRVRVAAAASTSIAVSQTSPLCIDQPRNQGKDRWGEARHPYPAENSQKGALLSPIGRKFWRRFHRGNGHSNVGITVDAET
ncbi:hypothetical protein FEP59_00911 [Burkholderia multivorans]|nr:hypothetical protein [Burkholderia multivorans]